MRWARHYLNHRALVAGIEAMGLEMNVPAGSRLWSLNAVRVPEGIDDARVRARLLEESNIEIGGGLGPGRTALGMVFAGAAGIDTIADMSGKPQQTQAEPGTFQAVLTPHRSLGPTGFLVLMIALGAVSFVTGHALVADGGALAQ